jgi:hypothetical protein
VNPDFRDLFSELNAAEARFLIVGAHAVTFHSVPRRKAAGRPQDLLDIDWLEKSREK